MAIAIGSRVALKALGVDLTIGQVSAQPPVFGVSQTADPGPCVIDWETGTQATVPVDVLDEILAASPTTLALMGNVVNVADYSAAYNALVVDAYNRGGGQECVVVRTLTSGVFYELDAASVVVQENL